MKILATNGRESCIVEISKDEVAQLSGFHSEYFARDKIVMTPGANMPIAEMYNRAIETLNAHRELKKEVVSAHARITRLIGLMDKKEDISKGP